jgi:threonine dehydratase
VFIRSEKLNDALGLDVTLATETFQRTGSFKFRGAANVAAKVPNRHVICVSSGNFGQAIACACKAAGKTCTVVMPSMSAQVKIDAVRGYGALVDLIDTRVIRRDARVAQLAQEFPDAYITSPFDDRLVVEGNASLGREIASFGVGFGAVICPVGGGGLISGLVTAFDECGFKTDIVGAEPLIANDAARSIREGRLVSNESESQTMADGARTLSLGKINWEIVQDRIRIVEVPEDAIKEAIKTLFLLANLKAEPTSGLSLAAAVIDRDRLQSKPVCCVVTGGNVDPSIYASLIA